MIKHTASILRWASARRTRENRLWQRPLALALLTLGLGSSGCLSDIDVSDCALHGTCGGSGASGVNGAMSTSEAGSGGESGEQEIAGEGGEPGNAGGQGAGAGNGGAPGSGTGATAPGGGGGNDGTSGGGGMGGMGGEAGGGTGGGGPRIITLSVPAPCRTNAYSTGLRAEAGTPPYRWNVSPPLEDWQVTDVPEHSGSGLALLASAHAGVPTVTVVVTDSAGKQDRVTYDVNPRASCWFAYTASTAAQGATLTVVDPLTRETPPVTLGHNQGVYDFAFSPNGKYLCYRFGADPDHERGTHLAVLDLVTWVEQQLNFSDAIGNSSDVVTAYAWSSDSSTLAVSFDHSGSQYLGGVRFTADGQLSKLTPKQTPVGVDSNLYWVGTSGVGYYADGYIDTSSGVPELIPYEGYVTGYYSPLGLAGFTEAQLTADKVYQLPVLMQATNDGFFINSPSLPDLQFNWVQPGGPQPVDHSARFISSSGGVAVKLSNGLLKLYRVEHSNEIATNATDRGCPKLLTWGESRERFACVRDVPENEQHGAYGELRIFDLASDDTLTVAPVLGGYCQSDPSQPAGPPCAWPTYDYSVADSTQQPRVLSPTGDWLAVSKDPAGSNQLYLIDLRTPPFSVEWTRQYIATNGNAVPTSKLLFSPDEKFLLQLLGGNVVVNSVTDGSSLSLPRFDVDAPDGDPICSDDFTANPERWCGSANRAPPFQWAPGSRSVAYRSRDLINDELIVIVDLLSNQQFGSQSFAAPSCGKKCSGQFAFQP